jgi:ribonucleoside-diphosphate reductase alpha chain
MDIKVKKRNGRLEDFTVDKINASAQRACEGIADVSASEIVLDAQLQLFDKITTREIDQALILSAREKIEKEPNYSKAAAQLLLNTLYKEVFKEGVDSDTFKLQYRKSFIQNTKKLVKLNRLDPKLLDFDLVKLSESLKI